MNPMFQNLKLIYPNRTAGGGFPLLNIGQYINLLLYNSYIIIGIGALFVIIFSGYSYITSAGDKNKLEQASKMLTYAILGLVVAFSVPMIISLFGIMTQFRFFNMPVR